MRKQMRKAIAWLLCAALIFCIAGSAGVQAATPTLPSEQAKGVPATHNVYAKPNETTFVPAGYTYVYNGENGQKYTRVADRDMYITGRVLTASEAAGLANLSPGEAGYVTAGDGTAITCREFDAKTAAAYSDAVREILGDAPVEDGQKVSVLSETFGASSPVKVMITFEDAAVAQMDTMQVQLGEPLGAAELDAMRAIQKQQQVMTQTISRRLGYDIQVSENFTLLSNAVSATVRYGDLAAINQMDGVKRAFLMPSYTIPEINATTVDSGISTNMKYAGPGMGANGAWDLGYQGEGMSVAVIDTGLCFENSSFTIQPKDQSLVAFDKEAIEKILAANVLHAETLTEGVTADDLYYSSKIPFGYNYADGVADYGSDDETWYGHGTHVAGIVAGNLVDEAKEEFGMDSMGIAPEAQLVVMKVFDADGYCYLDYLVAAIEDAIILGVDCANLSLGSSCGPMYYEGVTEVYDAAYEAGINVVVSAGNDASTGYKSYWGDEMVKSSTVSTGTLGMPGTFDSVLTVASMENSNTINFSDTSISWYNPSLGLRQILMYAECEDVPEGKGFRDRLSSQEFVFTDSMEQAEGKLVFVPFEGGNADSIAASAAKAKAAGVMLYDPSPEAEEEFSYISFTLTNFDVPMVSTSYREYSWMLQQKPPENRVRVDAQWNPSDFAGEMSSFSSWGPTDGLTLKPEITGIGGNVFSAYYGDNFAVASGTSMSSPAVAATAALVKQYLKTTDLNEEELTHVVNCLLMSTATPILDEEHGVFYPVRQQGAGLANAAAAVASQAYIRVDGTNKAKLELGDDPDRTGVYEMSFQVVNFSDTQKSYTLDTTVLGQVAQGGQIKNGQVTYLTYAHDKELEAPVTYSAQNGRIAVPANSTAKVKVTVTLSEADKAYIDERFPYGSYVEGFVQLLSDETPNLSVPFLAFYGDFGEAPILEEGTYETLLGGDRAYTTADHFHNSIWSYRPAYEQEELQGFVSQFYLGDSAGRDNEKVPASELRSAPAIGYMPFYSTNAGISPNGDSVMDGLGMGLGLRRNAKAICYTVTNVETGEVLWEQTTEFVSKTYFSDNSNAVMYGGILSEDALSLEWLYPVIELDWDDDGVTDYAYYDTSKCLLKENTWVSIQAQVIPEYESQTKNAHDMVTFTLYIDTTGPLSPENYCFSDRAQFEAAMGWGEMESEGDGMFHVLSIPDEYWFMDYAQDITLQYDEETGEWGGMIMTTTYASEVPAHGDNGVSEGGFSPFDSNSKQIFLAFDYAGNVSAYEMAGGEALLDLVEMKPEKTRINAGETIRIQNVAENDFATNPSWQVSDETVAKIVESDAGSCVLQGLKAGRVTVSAGFNDYRESVTIYVSDPAQRQVIAAQYQDIGNHWAKEEIIAAISLGFFRGTSNSTFAPEKALTRAELVTILYRMEGEPETEAVQQFQDVSANRWYTDAVSWAASNGIVLGKTADYFDPHGTVTREQTAAILYRYASYLGKDVSVRGDLSGYTDVGKISDYAKEAMSWAVASGLIQGVSKTTLAPKGSATRAQSAVLVIRFVDM